MKVDFGIWSRLTQTIVALVALAALLFIFTLYLPLIHQNERMRTAIYQLDTKIQQQEETAKKLQAQIDALRNDPKTVERLAREKLGYARADETVVRFETNAPGR